MKKILITGMNSYIGNSLEQWLKKNPEKYTVDKISLRSEQWKTKDFSIYDSIVHTVGIAHIKETKENHDLYYKINSDLAYSVAQKAKLQKVPQFIFLSSMSIYGKEVGVITEKMVPNPTSAYGKSKLEAEKKIASLQSNDFLVSIVRPPMVYGENCPGNYARLAKLAKLTPVFPKVNNKRSMIYIDILTEVLEKIIDDKLSGIYLPQNKEYVNTSEMVYMIAKYNNKKIKLVKLGSSFLPINKISVIRKIFGDLVYQTENELVTDNISFEETIEKTENKGNNNNELNK